MTLDDSRRWLIVVAALALGLLSACREAPVSTANLLSTVGASTTVGSVTTTTPMPTTEFDLDKFLSSKLGGVFLESEDTVGVVVLVPLRAESEVDAMLSSLPELEGYTHVSPDVVASAADRFATTEDTEPLNGEWVGFGLIPRFDDSPTADWVSTLSRIPDVQASQVEVAARRVRIPDGWSEVADLPFQLESGAIVEGLPGGIVVLQSDSTTVIDPAGSIETGDAPPISVAADCCGPADGLPGGDLLVLVAEGSTETWMLDPDSMTWREAAPRPDSGYVLGSAFIDGELFVVTAAARTGDGTSTVAALDLTSGVWRGLDLVPSPISVGGVTTDGERLIVAGTRQDGNNVVIGDRHPVAYQYTPLGGWIELPAPPIDGQSSTVAWVEAAGVLAWNYDLESALLDESGTWRRLGSVPMPPSECSPESKPARIGVVGFCGGIALFDGGGETWIPVSGLTDTRYGVVDGALLGLVQLDRDLTKLITHPLP
jgi:hypothetical protein